MPRGAGDFDIVLEAGVTLAANAPALAAFERAAQSWEDRFTDPITVTIQADLFDFGNAVTIGSTLPVVLNGPFATVRSFLVADSLNEPDDTIVASIPTEANFNYFAVNNYSANATKATKASLKAAGASGLDETFGASDGTIVFNTQFAFDFDSSDGITEDTVDFETVAAHEIAHLLGFFSNVDTVDQLVFAGAPPQPTQIATLDLFRFRRDMANNPAVVADFATFPRTQTPNSDDVTDDVEAEYRMSSGARTGDGRQASHWKDDHITGVLIGLMDPNLDQGEIHEITDADVRALDLIGYETNAVVCGNGSPR
ncbi:MAG TPA: NF038122 family metalloprotease [Candidatus Binatia bacterium]|nr:NF038122 family metalloprotease [Candidatus Binatia bacterium]